MSRVKDKADTYTVTLDRVPFPGDPPITQTRYVGDGKAVGAPPAGEPTWMNFTGPKVDVPPTDEPWYDTRAQASVRHRHDSKCLKQTRPGVDDGGNPIEVPVTGGPKAVTGGTIEIPEPGWYVCSTRANLYVHDHGAAGYVHHMSGDWLGGCPIPEEMPWD